MLTRESKFVPVDEKKDKWISSFFSTEAYGIQTEPKEVQALISSYSAASSTVSEGNF